MLKLKCNKPYGCRHLRVHWGRFTWLAALVVIAFFMHHDHATALLLLGSFEVR